MNQIIISGNVGKDAEKSQYDVRFTVATNKKYKDRNGEQKEETTWHNVVYKGKNEAVANLRKGDFVVVIGEQKNGSFKKQDGSYGNFSQIESFNVTVEPKVCKCAAEDMPNDDPDWLK